MIDLLVSIARTDDLTGMAKENIARS